MFDNVLFGVHLGSNSDGGLTCINIPGLFSYYDLDVDDIREPVKEALSCYEDITKVMIPISVDEVKALDASEDYDCYMVYMRSINRLKVFDNAADCSFMFDYS